MSARGGAGALRDMTRALAVLLMTCGALAGACKTADEASASDPSNEATGGDPGSGGASAMGGAPSDAGDQPIDAPAADGPGAPDSAAGDGGPPGDEFPGKPVVRLCKKEWTHEECCAFLCSCLSTICSDSAKGKPGIGNCMTWCPKLSDMATRCHVYHCYVSISPTGGIKDHDSHCGHAANQVAGGDCPTLVYQRP